VLNRCRVGHLLGYFAWTVLKLVNIVAFIMDACVRAYGALWPLLER
jgi:hypothetical protein